MKYILIILFVFSPQILAITFDGGEVNIPQEFTGYKKRENDKHLAHFFAKPHVDGTHALIGISISTPTEEMKKKGPVYSNQFNQDEIKSYILKYLSTSQGSKSNLKRSEIEMIKNNGVYIAKLKWTGTEKNNRKMEGMTYLYVFNSKVITFMVQDFVEHKSVNIIKAINAFESNIIPDQIKTHK